FPVSSKSSLEEKEQNLPLNEEMQAFEHSFYPFIEEDLAALTIETAMWDVNRAKSMLDSFIHTANLDDTAQEKAIEQLRHKLNQFETVVYDVQTSTAENRMKERIERQIHFVLERLFIRYHDMFSQFFNPTTIRSEERRVGKEWRSWM